MNIRTPFVVAALLVLAACTNTSTSPAPATSGAVTAPSTATAANTTSEAVPAATGATSASAASDACTKEQFVACETGEACATRQGKLVKPRPCFDHAADACAAAACTHGCDIYKGTPNQIHCAVNASSTGHMKRCGGLANWGCPEKMRCDGMDPRVDDAMGTCVPAS